MRRIVAGLVAVAVACAAALVTFLVIAARLMAEIATWFGQDQQPTQHQIEESQRIGQISNALGLACGPLVAGALLAVVAILALLAFRWELRRA